MMKRSNNTFTKKWFERSVSEILSEGLKQKHRFSRFWEGLHQATGPQPCAIALGAIHAPSSKIWRPGTKSSEPVE